MDNHPDQFEQALNRVLAGEPLERVLTGMSAADADLLRLALAMRETRQPEIDPLKAQFQRSQVETAAAMSDAGQPEIDPLQAPAWRSHAKAEAVQSVLHAQKTTPRRSAPKKTWLLGGIGAAGFAMAAFLVVLAGVLIFGRPAGASAAVIDSVQGVVEVASSADAGDWAVVEDGQRIHAGQALRTRVESDATLTLYEGSRVQLGPDVLVVVEHLSGKWGGTVQLELLQLAGETTHTVTPLRGSGSYYRVLTPSGQAAVHGTTFRVAVNDGDGAFFAVDHGEVAVSRDDVQVVLTAGQATLVEAEGAPEDARYEFYAQGELLAIAGDQWTVGGLTITVSAELANGFVVGDEVAVRGRILADGTYQADRISYARNDQEKLRFSGVVESIAADRWVISGKTVLVGAETEIDGDLAVGDVVSVSFTILEDGSWLAREIEALDDEDEDKTPTPVTPTLSPSPTAEGTLTPTVTLTPTPTLEGTLTPELTPSLTATLEPSPTGVRAGCDLTGWEQPKGASLAAKWGVPYEEIMGWFCQRYGFGEIDLAYELAAMSGKPVDEIFAMRASGMGWGNVKKAIEEQVATPEPHGKKPTKEPKPKKKDN
ncbi:MAG: FecR domain-containing protein [Anaerolineae bacterium]|nr:FecR domain-containing protein [Anaerolineae bacterium]